jgi:hypothetical protein
MEPTAEGEVLRYWLAREVGKREDGVEPSALSPEEALDALLRYKPGAADFVWRDRPIEWYRLDLPRSRFERLRLIDGPSGLLWRALSDDGTVMGAARRVAAADADALERETGVDVSAVHDYRAAVAAGEDLGALVVTTRSGRAPWHVADGNHRATARALHLLESGEYDPQPAFVAVGSNPVVRPLRERLGGLLARIRGASPPFQR